MIALRGRTQTISGCMNCGWMTACYRLLMAVQSAILQDQYGLVSCVPIKVTHFTQCLISSAGINPSSEIWHAILWYSWLLNAYVIPLTLVVFLHYLIYINQWEMMLLSLSQMRKYLRKLTYFINLHWIFNVFWQIWHIRFVIILLEL